MTTPQDPGHDPGQGDTPQDPSDPQNPYGTPPPPPPPPPNVPPADPAAPITPIPASPPPYGDPSATQAPTPAPTPPPMSPMPPAYGQPAYGQPAYGPPGYPPGATAPGEPGKGMAVAALLISFLGCTCLGAIVSIVLSIMVFRRSKADGRNHGKGLAVAAIVISSLSLLVGIGIAALIGYASTLTSVDDLKTGTCFTADGITGDGDGVSNIEIVSCSKSHDAEVFSSGNLTKAQADSFDNSICTDAAQGLADVLVPPLGYNALADASAGAGDRFVCYAYNTDGSALTSKLGS